MLPASHRCSALSSDAAKQWDEEGPEFISRCPHYGGVKLYTRIEIGIIKKNAKEGRGGRIMEALEGSNWRIARRSERQQRGVKNIKTRRFANSVS